jgi:hypothetical protein
MVARERHQGGMALHSTTLGYGVVPAVLGSALVVDMIPYRSTALTSSILFSRA